MTHPNDLVERVAEAIEQEVLPGHIQQALEIYLRVHHEFDEGKEWGEIDNGLVGAAKDWSYDFWLGYMQQTLINSVKQLALKFKHRRTEIASAALTAASTWLTDRVSKASDPAPSAKALRASQREPAEWRAKL